MPYLGRTPAGAAGNKITGDLKVTGTLSADSISNNIVLDGTDGSSSNANDNIIMDGTDSDSTNVNDNLLYEEKLVLFKEIHGLNIFFLLRLGKERKKVQVLV